MGNPLLAVPEETPIPVLLNAKQVAAGVWALQVSDEGASPVASYNLNDFADGTPLYLGKVKADGTWLVQRFNPTTGEMRYANLSNNSGLNYTSAWTSRATLTYALFQSLTGV
jgi:hypothetical protein